MTMKLSKTFFTGILALTLVFTLFFSACKSDDDDGGSGGGGSPGTGTITISGIKAGFLDGGKILHSTVSGVHDQLNDFRLVGGVLSGASFDSSGSTTINSNTITIPVRGQKGGSSYEFTDGSYTVILTVNGVTGDATLNGNYTLKVNFSGSSGTGTANTSNGLGSAAP
jgi:hypothetical protein